MLKTTVINHFNMLIKSSTYFFKEIISPAIAIIAANKDFLFDFYQIDRF